MRRHPVPSGGVAAGVNLVARAVLQPLMGFEAAVAAAYVCGMIVAYNLFRVFVFGASGRSVASEAWRFTLVNLVSMVLVWIIWLVVAGVAAPGVGIEGAGSAAGSGTVAGAASIGSRSPSCTKPWCASTALITAGLGSANTALTTDTKGPHSTRARCNSPCFNKRITSTNRAVHRCALAVMDTLAPAQCGA